MKIPATFNGEMVYIVAIDTRSPADAVCVFPDGGFGRVVLDNLRVIEAPPTTSFLPDEDPTLEDA
jgi:hypothetical protein